jgi:hypothetical protein
VIAPVASANDALEHIPPTIALVTIDGDPQRSAALVTVDQVAGGRDATPPRKGRRRCIDPRGERPRLRGAGRRRGEAGVFFGEASLAHKTVE